MGLVTGHGTHFLLVCSDPLPVLCFGVRRVIEWFAHARNPGTAWVRAPTHATAAPSPAVLAQCTPTDSSAQLAFVRLQFLDQLIVSAFTPSACYSAYPRATSRLLLHHARRPPTSPATTSPAGDALDGTPETHTSCITQPFIAVITFVPYVLIVSLSLMIAAKCQ